MPTHWRTIWISDVHLGTEASRAGDLLNFLQHVIADRIYLVGDIIDFEKMQSRIGLPQAHQQVIARLVELANEGTKVCYIPGNHDYHVRQYAGHEVRGIRILMEAIHHSANGKRLLVMHGDILDGRVRQGTNLGKFGATAYRLLMKLDVTINQMRTKLGRDYVPLSARIKGRLAAANRYIGRFEEIAAAYAEERGFDGVVCGHIHRPSIRQIGSICFANDGDWVEHRTAVAEAHDGTLSILRWNGNAIIRTEEKNERQSIAA